VLQASDIIVLPFRASTTSGSLVQALSWPRPCIVPRMGCLPTQMGDDAGILYPADDPGALEAALRDARRLDLDAARQAAWRSAVRADWDDVARRTIEAYRA
jgi:glycosyltransferase involved in cell wall biosynthesis